MITLFKPVALCAVLAASVLMVQGCADTTLASKAKDADVTVSYKAIVNSKDQQQTIAELVADGKNPDTVASVATVAGVPLATIEAALPTIPESRLLADSSAALTDPVAYTPSAAAGIEQTDGSRSKAPHSLRQSF